MNAQTLVPIPKLTNRVVDLASIIEPATKIQIESILSKLEQEKGTQIAVLTISSTKPEEIEQFGIRLAEAWKIGRKKINDGVILIVASEDRKARIEVGYGLEGTLTDVTSKRIIESFIIPEFKSGNFSLGVLKGVSAIVSLARKENLPFPSQVSGSDGRILLIVLVLLIFLFVIIGLLDKYCPGARLLADTVIIGSISSSRNSGRFTGGGGFSGGGGSFGGGGASGSW